MQPAEPKPPGGAGLTAAAAAGGLALGLVLDALLGESLFDLSFATGWLVSFVVFLGAFAWWRTAHRPGSRAASARFQLILTTLLLGLFLLHADFQVPQGWIEIALTITLLATVASAMRGVSLVGARAQVDASAVGAWLCRHAALNCALVTLAVFHALCTYAHGALAYLLVYGNTT